MDNDCFLGHICLNNRCIYACRSDEDCSSTESCLNNTCTNPCNLSPCGPNAGCTVFNHRAQCACLNGLVPSPTAKIGCIRSPSSPCTSNRNCQDGLTCIQNECKSRCSSDRECYSNERCESGVCKPLCRRDDDCRYGEVCQDFICSAGCRADAHCPGNLACVGQKCVDPCLEPTACGSNANCVVQNHVKACICPDYLVGDPSIGCKYAPTSCSNHNECPPNHSCFGNVCQANCNNDQSCLADERCIRGTCRSICNSDASCGNEQICENRLCQIGCRNDLSCSGSEACINNKCQDPCTTTTQCGTCAECLVINHVVQCSCPNGFLGNPFTGCNLPLQRCNSFCQCDESGQYCAESCTTDTQCSCGQICATGKCRSRCNPGNCLEGQLCQDGACIAGCRNNLDCSGDRSCINGQCLDPCTLDNTCGENSICRVSEHRVICLCPDGFRGEPTQGCTRSECSVDSDCEIDKRCETGSCRNPCLQTGACGVNAQCRVVNRRKQCSCPPGHFGNPAIECSLETSPCARNPCGPNTRCRDANGGYECTCAPGCVGDPHKGCLCGGESVAVCAGHTCGRNAACRIVNQNEAECYCPPLYPNGDPSYECKDLFFIHFFFRCPNLSSKVKIQIVFHLISGTPLRDFSDCRQYGCASGECIREGSQFVCRQGMCSKYLSIFLIEICLIRIGHAKEMVYAFQSNH